MRADHVFLNLSTQHRQLRDSNNEQIHDFSSALNYILTNKIKSLKLSTQADKHQFCRFYINTVNDLLITTFIENTNRNGLLFLSGSCMCGLLFLSGCSLGRFSQTVCVAFYFCLALYPDVLNHCISSLWFCFAV